MLIDDLVNKIIGRGMDLGTKDAVKSALQLIGGDSTMVDEVYIELKNKLTRKEFKKIPKRDRALFLPQCMKHSENCVAKLTETGIICEHCGSCKISEIWKEAENLGYSVYVVPGGSMVFKIIKAKQPKGCVGVACFFELEEAVEKLTAMNIPYQCVPLIRDGCKDTQADINRILTILRS